MNLPKVTAREMVRLLRQRAEKAEARVAELLGLLGEVRPELNQYNVSLGTLTRIEAALRGGKESQ